MISMRGVSLVISVTLLFVAHFHQSLCGSGASTCGGLWDERYPGADRNTMVLIVVSLPFAWVGGSA